MIRRTTRSPRPARTAGRDRREDRPEAPVQGGLWGDDVTVPTPTRPDPVPTNDPQRWAQALAAAADPGLMVTQGRGGSRRVMRRVPGTDDRVAPLPAADAAVVLQALASGHVELGIGHHQVRHGRYEGPAVRVLVPAKTRSLLARWAALRPLTGEG